MTNPFQVKRIDVPGVLSDDALQEQLKQFAKNKNLEQNAAPPPDSAVDFADRIQREYLDKPTPLVRNAPAALPGPLGVLAGGLSTASQAGPPPPDAQAQAIDARSNILSDAMSAVPPGVRSLLFGPTAEFMKGGIFDQLGTLSPEERKAAAEQQVQDAADEIKIAQDTADTRKRLQDMSNEEKDALGIPHMDILVSQSMAVEMFEAAAQNDAKFLAEKQKQHAEAVAILADPSKWPTQAVWLDAIQSGLRSAADMPISAARGATEWMEMGRDFLFLGHGEKSTARAAVDTVSATLDKMMPGDKTRSRDFIHQLAAGGGSMAAFLVGGYAAQALGIGATVATAGLGAMSQGDQQFQDAEQHGARGLQKYLALIAGSGLGLTEAIPIDRMFHSAEVATGGLVSRLLQTTAAGAVPEFLQEFGQQVGSDVVAKWLYDSKREIDWNSALMQGVIGGITGGLAGAAVGALHEAGVSPGPTAEPFIKPAEKEAVVTSVIDDLQKRIDQLPGIADAEQQATAEQLLGGAADAQASTGAGTETQGSFASLQGKVDASAQASTGAAAEAQGVYANIQGKVEATTQAGTGAPAQQMVQGPGGSIPVNPNGQFELHHYGPSGIDIIDPAKRGTGGLRGEERARLGPPGSNYPNVVDRSYFGVGDPTFVDRLIAANRKLPARKKVMVKQTDPYYGENLGPSHYVVHVDPNRIYNWFEDPLNLRAKLDRSTPPQEQVTRYEKLIHDAGFDGVYFSQSRLGQTAIMFKPTTPTTADGMKTQFEVPDVKAVQLDPTDVQPLPGLTNSPGPVPSVVQAARAYAEARGLPVRRQAEYVKADPERGRRIANAYAKMKHDPENPRVQAAYKAMIDETLAQYQFVKATGLKVEAIEPGMPDPYPQGPKQVLEDLQRGHLWFFPTDQGFGTLTDIKDNPLLAPTKEKIGDRTLLANDVFRIVHDFFGHGIEGAGFGARGEENAWQSHMRLYSKAALPAVTSETRGQNSWVNFGPHGEANRANQRDTVYADQKTGIMPSWTWTEGVADDSRAQDSLDLLARVEKPDRVKKLMEEVPGLKGVMKHMTPDERAKLSRANAAKIVDIFTTLPDAKEMASVAISGRAKKGWYARSAQALVDIFGLKDAPRFAALLAALSPQTSVENNAVNALRMWTAWVNADRPTDKKAIMRLLGQSVQGSKGEDSVLPAWVNNTVTALTEPDEMTITLSGPKVDSFMRNLQGQVVSVTNDAWMANFANVEQTLFAKTGASPGKGPGYVAMSAVVRQAADVATKMTGETWTPAEIQETVWSWAKTLYEKASSADELRTAEEIIKAGGMTAEEISATPDFASLFVSGAYRNILEKGGYNVDAIAERSSRADAGAGQGGSPVSAEGTRIAQRTFEQHLKRAAQRLDALRARRAEAEQPRAPLTFDINDTFFPQQQQAADQSQISHLTPEDLAAIDQGLFANTSSTRNALTAEQQRPAQGVPTPASAEVVDVSLSKISRNVIKLLDLTARQGRLTLKGGAVGQYSRKQDVVRVKTWNDLETLVHEGGHAVFFDAGGRLKQFIAGNDTVLKQVATDLYGGDVNTLSDAQHVAEGFAEFFRVYTLNRAYADSHYAQLAADFDAVLEAEAPQLKTGLETVGEQYRAWLQLPSQQLVRNMIVSGKQTAGLNAAMRDLRELGFGTWFHEVTRRSIDASVNRYASLSDITGQLLSIGQANAGKAIDLKQADNPYVLMRLATNAGARAQVQLTDGVMGYRSTAPSTRGLREALLRYHGLGKDANLKAIDPVRQQDFAAYLVALRGIDEYRRLDLGEIERPPVAATLGDLLQTVDELNAKYGTDFVEAALMVHEYGMGLWQKQYDAGLMDRDTYVDGKKRLFYAPLQRDMSDKKASLGSSALTSGASIVKRFRGSDRDIVDPMDVLMHKTFALEQIVAKNDVAQALGLLADKAGKAGALVERVPAQQLIGKQFSVREVARQLTKDDTVSASDAADLMTILQASIENDNVISMFRQEQASTKGENVIFYWEKGKLAALQLADGDLGADVVNVMNGLGRETLPLFTGLLSSTTQVFRAGIVSWPDFLIKNFIVDQFATAIITDVGYKPFVSGLKGVYDELRQRDWARQYNAAMGSMGGMNVANLHDTRLNRDIAALRKKGYLVRAFGGRGLRGTLDGFAHVMELTETGTRLGVFQAAYKRARADGLTDWEASIEAAYTAMDMRDFGLNGSRTLVFRKTIPFLNAQLQGLYKMLRVLGADEVRQRQGLGFVLKAYFKSTRNMNLSRVEKQAINTGRKAWIKMAALGLFSAALHFLFQDDPDYQEAGEYLRATNWVIPTGNGRLFVIPKPYELALLANFTERALESASGDPTAKDRFMRSLYLTLAPNIAPPLIQALVDQHYNKDSFTGREIVPSYMQALAPELQFNNYTSEMAKKIGATMGWSPMVVDHFMSSLGASAYRDVMTMVNGLDPNRPSMDATDAPILRRFIRDVRRGSASAQDFWGEASTLNGSLRGAEVSYKNLLASGNEIAANEFLNTLDEDHRAYAILATNFEADAKRLNPFYRARQLTTIVSAMRREMVSPLGLADTTTKFTGAIQMTADEKAAVDEALSEYARREMRNTLIAMGAPGWAGKRVISAQSTIDLLAAIDPRVSEELVRRIDKANVYSFDTVNTYWPEVKDRLLRDRENTFLKDILTIAKVMK